jgi:subtilisin family serine protease
MTARTLVIAACFASLPLTSLTAVSSTDLVSLVSKPALAGAADTPVLSIQLVAASGETKPQTDDSDGRLPAVIFPPGFEVLPIDGDESFIADWYVTRNKLVLADSSLTADPTSVLIQFADNTPLALQQMTLDVISGRVINSWPLVPGLLHVAIPGDPDKVVDFLKQWGDATGLVEFAERDLFYRVGAIPNDPSFALEWGLRNTGQTINGSVGISGVDIRMSTAWDTIRGSSTFVVGMCDTGIRRFHDDLYSNMWVNSVDIAGNSIDEDRNGVLNDTWGWDFWNNDRDPTDDNGHGTHTAGTVGAVGNNSRGVSGVCQTVRMAAIKIASATGSLSTTTAISSINYCVATRIKVSNHSWGGPGFSQSLSNAISAARTAGHLLVCAAGNGGSDARGDNNDTLPTYPASYNFDNVISVAAVDNRGALAGFSNFGPTSVDFAAPGVNIISTWFTSNTAYVYLNGTSMATPHATGVASLVAMRYPTWTPGQIRARLISSSRPLPALTGKCVSGGMLNATAAVQ